tara:strand:- start:4 stop:1284 length:1281 start_codon:yes stop_codon:yes gene_type:complete
MATPNRTASILDDLIDGFKSDFNTARLGRHAAYENLGKSEGRTAAQNIGGFAGRVASDVIGDETRNTYWRYNHPLAVSSFAGNDALKVTGMPVGYQALGGAALALGVMPIASGNLDISNLGEFGRPKGYQALFADPTDKTKTTNPLGEFAGRYFLGRKGNILPYEELVKERPDVTPEKYAAAVQSGGFMSKDFFGLQDDPTKSIALGIGAGALLGAYSRRGKYSRGADGKIKVEPRVVTSMENIPIHSYRTQEKTYKSGPKAGETIYYRGKPVTEEVRSAEPIGRYWIEDPVRIERGRPEDLTSGAIKGAVLGGLVGSVVPSIAELGAIKTQKSLSGEDSISLLGYEVPMSAALLTAGAGVGLNYWARKHFKPNDYSDKNPEGWINRYMGANSKKKEQEMGVGWNANDREWQAGYTTEDIASSLGM